MIARHDLTATIALGFPVVWCDVTARGVLVDVLEGQVPSRALLFVDSGAWRHHADRLLPMFAEIAIEVVQVEVCEAEKNEVLLHSVVSHLNAFEPLRRSEPIFVVGGGVLMDVVGFACSIYARGIPYVRIPTTVIGQVDAGVGLKTGINVGMKKNRLGAFHPPIATVNDPALLTSLPARQVSNGLGEVLKAGLARDASICDLLEHLLQAGGPSSVVSSAEGISVLIRSAQVMTDELSADAFEADLCRSMDFGHTFSPRIELAAEDLLHGEAVAIDMHLSAVLAHGRGLLTSAELNRIAALLRLSELPLWDRVCTPDELWAAVMTATRHRDGMQRIPLPSGIGGLVFVNDLTQGELATGVNQLALVDA